MNPTIRPSPPDRLRSAIPVPTIVMVAVAALAATADAAPPGQLPAQEPQLSAAALLQRIEAERASLPAGVAVQKDVRDPRDDVRFREAHERCIALAEAVFRDNAADVEQLQVAVDAKRTSLLALWKYYGSKRLAQPVGPYDRFPGDAFVAEMSRSDRPFLRREAALTHLAVDSMEWQNYTVKSVQDLGQDAKFRRMMEALIANARPLAADVGDCSENQFYVLMGVLRHLEAFAVALDQKGLPQYREQIVAIYRDLLSRGARSSNPRIPSLIQTFNIEGIVRGLALLGETPDIQGTTRDGRDFDIARWRGKVVVVEVFDAEDESVAELTRLRGLYDRYHARGLEVVGVCSGRNFADAAAIDTILRQANVPWPTIYDTNAAARRAPQPIAQRYGFMWLPITMLVNREGRVAYLDAADERVERLVEDLLQADSSRAAANTAANTAAITTATPPQMPPGTAAPRPPTEPATTTTWKHERFDEAELRQMGKGSIDRAMSTLGEQGFELFFVSSALESGGAGFHYFKRSPWTAPVPRFRYEYIRKDLKEILDAGQGSFSRGMQTFEKDGWEIVAVTTLQDGSVGWHYLKRNRDAPRAR